MSRIDFIWNLGTPPGPVHVVDVGANPIGGRTPYGALLDRGYAAVTGFEPQPEALAALLQAKGPRETYHAAALGDGGPVDLRLYAHSGFASAFDVRSDVARMVGMARATRPAGSVRLDTRRLDDLAEVPGADFLKIDAQGSEQSVISNARSALSAAVLVQAEVRFLPLYAGEPSFGAVQAELAAQGFVLHDFAFLKRVPLRSRSSGALRPRHNRQILDGDAWFVRDLTTIADWQAAQVWKLALLAEAVVGSPGLVVYCLDALAERGAVPAEAAEGYLALLAAGAAG